MIFCAKCHRLRHRHRVSILIKRTRLVAVLHGVLASIEAVGADRLHHCLVPLARLAAASCQAASRVAESYLSLLVFMESHRWLLHHHRWPRRARRRTCRADFCCNIASHASVVAVASNRRHEQRRAAKRALVFKSLLVAVSCIQCAGFGCGPCRDQMACSCILCPLRVDPAINRANYIGSASTTDRSALSRFDGRAFPRLSARRRIPAHAFALKKNRCGTTPVSKVSNNEHTTAALGHSEVLSVQHAVGPPIPEFAQRPEEGTKVPSSSAGQDARDIFPDDPART